MVAENIYTTPDFTTTAFVQGFKPEAFTDTTITFGPGSARALNNTWIMEYPSNIPNVPGEITVNTAVQGVNGCWPLPIASVVPESGFIILPVYIIGNSSGTTSGSLNANIEPAMIIATAATNFVLPGYNVYRQIGIVVLDSSGNLVPYGMQGDYETRTVTLAQAQAFLTGGNATSRTQISISFLPYNMVKSINVLYTYTPANVINVATMAPAGAPTLTPAPIQVRNSAAAQANGNFQMAAGQDSSGNCAIEYSVTGAGDALSLFLAGFEFNMPFTN